MKASLLLCALTLPLFPVVAEAQLPSSDFPIAGKFYVDVDDTVTIFQNGVNIHHGEWGTSQSKEVNLLPGDRLVIQLWNKVGPYGLKLLFVSTDRKTIVNFTTNSFRVLRDPDKHDLTEKEYVALKDPAHGVRRSNRDHLAFKNKAEWVWGEKKMGKTYIAGLITKFMFERFAP